MSWQVITGFVRIGTNSRIFAVPMTIEQAEKVLENLFSQSNVTIVLPGSNHWQIFLQLLKDANATADLVMDAHLAALAIEHDGAIATTDKDFAKFSAVKHFNPLPP